MGGRRIPVEAVYLASYAVGPCLLVREGPVPRSAVAASRLLSYDLTPRRAESQAVAWSLFQRLPSIFTACRVAWLRWLVARGRLLP